MFTISTLFVFLSFYIAYNTSKKIVIHSRLGFEPYVYDHQKTAKRMSLVLGIIAWALQAKLFGPTSGIFIFLITVMTVGSFTILMAPLQLIRQKIMALLFIGAFCIELFAF